MCGTVSVSRVGETVLWSQCENGEIKMNSLYILITL